MNKTKITITLEDRGDGQKFDIELTVPMERFGEASVACDHSFKDYIGDVFDADVVSVVYS